MKITKLTAGLLAASLALAPVAALAGPPKWAPGHKKSAAPYAPGQVKKRHAHHGHIHGNDWIRVDDYRRWGLKPPPDGHRYVRKDGKIYEIVKDTLAIIGAVAVVNALID